MPETLHSSAAPGDPAPPRWRCEPTAPQAPSLAPISPTPSAPGASRGQTLFEYALIILFVVLAVVLSLALIAPALNNVFNQVPNAF